MPIPASEIQAWLGINAVDDVELRREYFILIREMDEVWLTYNQERIDADSKKKTTK